MTFYRVSISRPLCIPNNENERKTEIYACDQTRVVIGKFSKSGTTLWCTAKNMDTKVAIYVMSHSIFKGKINRLLNSKTRLAELKQKDKLVCVDIIVEKVVTKILLGGSAKERLSKDLEIQSRKNKQYQTLEPILAKHSVLSQFERTFAEKFKQEKENDNFFNNNLLVYDSHLNGKGLTFPHCETPLHDLCLEIGFHLIELIKNTETSAHNQKKAITALVDLSQTEIPCFKVLLYSGVSG